MNPNSVLSVFTDHPGLFATLVPLALSVAHSRLSRWPIIQVISRYAGIFPVARIAAVELAQAVLAQWGPGEKADVATVESELRGMVTGAAPATSPPGMNGPAAAVPAQPAPGFNLEAARANNPELVKTP